jgi:hypothetical protein
MDNSPSTSSYGKAGWRNATVMVARSTGSVRKFQEDNLHRLPLALDYVHRKDRGGKNLLSNGNHIGACGVIRTFFLLLLSSLY